jgi:hypothetical protein
MGLRLRPKKHEECIELDDNYGEFEPNSMESPVFIFLIRSALYSAFAQVSA